MIARIWHGATPAAQAGAYYRILQRTGLPDYRKTPGNRGVVVLRKIENEQAHFLLVSYWDSMAAIEAFVGADTARARYYPEDDGFLLEKEPFVQHYEVLEER
jgi:heme-degrading monooxygenase HmoA